MSRWVDVTDVGQQQNGEQRERSLNNFVFWPTLVMRNYWWIKSTFLKSWEGQRRNIRNAVYWVSLAHGSRKHVPSSQTIQVDREAESAILWGSKLNPGWTELFIRDDLLNCWLWVSFFVYRESACYLLMLHMKLSARLFQRQKSSSSFMVIIWM